MIPEQGFSIVDIHEPIIAMLPPSIFLHTMDSHPHRNKIFLIGRHQEVRQLDTHGLHCITSVSHHCGIVAQRKTYVECGKVENSLTSASSRDGDLLKSMPQGSAEMVEWYWSMVI